MLAFSSNRMLAVGEAMIEMAVIGDDTYHRSFAGDTFNTAWHMSQIPDLSLQVGFVTKVGTDSVSDSFVDMVCEDGIDVAYVGRVPDRTMGLYMIELDEAERSFSYWREASAARLLARDESWLDQAFAGAGLIHLSGITLGILNVDSRERLLSSLRKARTAGTRVSFDPNVRPVLWVSPDEARTAMKNFFAVSDIALPSFDDEAGLWGDRSPDQTIDRISALGVSEVIVKNGTDSVCIGAEGRHNVPTRHADELRDTSGAGDAFNAGYLAARISGKTPTAAVAGGQTLALEVIRHFGARIPKSLVPTLPT